MFGQEKKKDLGFAEALATVSVRMVFDGPGGDLIKENSHDQDEIDRFMFSLITGHIAMATAAINLNLSINDSRKMRILDHLEETFKKKLGKQSQEFHIRKYIVDNHEVEMIEADCGSSDFTTNMKRLLSLTYESRVEQYESAIREGLERAKKDDGSRINPFLKMIKAMGKHVYGDDYTMDAVFISKLSSVMFACLQSMMSVCEEYE